jgi:hypothetical protein
MRRWIFISLLLLLMHSALDAQPVRVSPSEIYPSDNVITLEHVNGIARVDVVGTTDNVRVLDGTRRSGCERTATLRVHLSTAHRPGTIRLEVTDCRGGVHQVALTSVKTWRLETRNFGVLEPGERLCARFQITTENGDILDTVTVDDPRVSIRFFTSLPYRIRIGQEYQYEVCFQADEPGVYRFPVVTWMRREQPAGGLTNYPVADTGFVTVRVPPPPPVADPTTFRSVAVPNAVVPPKGTAFVGVYDVLGIVAGYSLTDNIMLIGGGALPLPDDWGGVRGQMYGAASIGAKAGMSVGEGIDVAVGYQLARSIYDEEATRNAVESQITVNAPWGAISYGDEDSRASLTVGYAFKRHVKPEITFDDDALIIAAGGDYRFAHHWKFAGEIAYMETLGVVPIVATARYFSDTYAIDAGIGFAGITIGDAPAPAFPLIPVLSAVFVF